MNFCPSWAFWPLRDTAAIDIIVRGEGYATAPALINALASNTPLQIIRGIAFRHNGLFHATQPTTMIKDIDIVRVGWELIDFSAHSYWGGERAVVLQFSRGAARIFAPIAASAGSEPGGVIATRSNLPSKSLGWSGPMAWN